MSTAPIGGVRDVVANRSFVTGGAGIGSTSVQVISSGDTAITTFCPTPGAIHTFAGTALTAGRTWTITDAVSALPYDLKIGEGFLFFVQHNNTGNFAITIGVGGNVAAGVGTMTIAQNRTRIFSLTRISNLVHQLDTLGTLNQ